MDKEYKGGIPIKYIKIYKFLEKFPFGRNIAVLVLMIKFFPLIVISHDWKISSKSGISYYIRKFTLSEIIYNLNSVALFYTILYICFILIIFNFITLIRILLFNKEIYFSSFLKKVNFILYLCCPYLYSIFTEIIFNTQIKNNISNTNYIISIIVISICVIYLVILDILISSVLLEEPSFIGNNSILTNEIGKLDFLSCCSAFLQIIIQIEFNIKETHSIVLKIVIRCLFTISILFYFFNHSIYYYRIKIEYSIKFIFFLCFSSIVIEFCSLNEYYINDRFIFQEDNSLLVLKIFIEIILGILITSLYFKIEFRLIIRDFSNFNFNVYGTYNNNIIKVFNLIYFMDCPDELNRILTQLNKTFKRKVHIPRCKLEDKYCFFCHLYDYSNFENEIKNYINTLKRNKSSTQKINVVKCCPILYQYFSKGFENIKFMNINNKKFYTAVSILVTFYYAFEKQYFKCLYLIETVKFNPYIQKTFLNGLQLFIIKSRILNFYNERKKNRLENYVDIKKEEEEEIKFVYQFTRNFDSVNKIIKIEKSIKNLLKNFQNVMRIFNEEDISFSTFSILIKNFSDNYQIYLNKLQFLFNKLRCSIRYPLKKVTIPFDFLISEIPKEIIKPTNKFFSNQPSLNDEDKKTYIVTINTQFSDNNFIFSINYISDEFVQKLNYSKSELYSLNFIELFPKYFSKSYSYIFGVNIEKGTEFLKIKNLCLQDKFQYVSLFDFKGVAITNQKGIELFFQLEDAKEEKLLEKNKSNNNKEFNNNSNIAGTCFFFTNKSGKIIHISRGFEDYFFLNSIVLSQYKIYANDLFNIKKLKKKGSFEIDLFKVLDNINEIYNKEIGQISEDEFSKLIVKLRSFEETLNAIKFNFLISGTFEQRKLEIPKNKEKILYIFCLILKLNDLKTASQEAGILCLENLINKNKQIITSNSHRSNYENSIITNLEDISSAPQSFDKESRFWFLLKKVKNINKMCVILLKKYFKININQNESNSENSNETEDEKTIKDKEDKEILDYNEMSTKKLKASFMVKIQSYTFLEQYLPSLLSFLFYITLTIMFILKINEILNLKDYIYSFGAGNMYVQIVNQIILKVLQLQFIANGIHEEQLLDGLYNNSWERNINQLNKRIEEYIIYVSKYRAFLTDNEKGRKYILPNIKKKGNYSVPLINGSKTIEVYDVFHNYVHVILNEIRNDGKIPVIYNNSKYYFNDSMIDQFSFSRIEYYDKVLSYVEFLENFSFYFTYVASESQTIFYNVVISHEISLQKKLSFVILIISISFSIFTLIQFYLFFKKTFVLFSNYFLGYIRLRFFNNYINYKIELVLDFIDNYSKENSINKKMDEIEIIQNNIEEFILKNIMNDQYERFNAIKVQPFKVKNTVNYNNNSFQEFEKTILENRNELFELSKNFSESRVVDSPRLFYILKKQSSYKVPTNKNNILLSPNLKLKDYTKGSIPINSNNYNKPSNLQERKSNFHQFKENRESTSNINKSTNSNNYPQTITNFSNLSMSKSNVNLINSTNRSGISNKSSLKLLNEESKNNLSQNKSVSKNKLIKNEKENDIQKKYLSTGKTLLDKPNLYFNFLLFLFIMILVCIGIAAIQIILSINFINNTISMTQTQYNIFLYLKYNIQIIFFYGFMILKNEPLVFYYQANKYTSDCKPIDTHMKANYTHSIFIESQTCYQTLKTTLEKIRTGSINKNLIELKHIHKKFFSSEFCQSFAKFIIDHKSSPEIEELSYLRDDTYEILYEECKIIGNGLNSKGYNIAIDTIHQTLIGYYEDFVNDDRTEESNLKRVKDKFFESALIENVEITKKLTVIYLIAFNKDFEAFREKIIYIETFLFIIQIIVMLIITVSYIRNLKKYESETQKVNFFNKCLINSILYK